MKNLVFVDAETDGLYGAFISVAMIVTDEKCNEIERHYWGISKDNLIVTDPWVKETVLPILGDYDKCDSEDELLEKVWKIWDNYREDAYAVGDVISPVETRLFANCVNAKMPERKFQGPFPFIDISSFLLAKGYDPLIERTKLLGITDSSQHNALFDVEMSIAIYKRLILEDINE